MLQMERPLSGRARCVLWQSDFLATLTAKATEKMNSPEAVTAGSSFLPSSQHSHPG